MAADERVVHRVESTLRILQHPEVDVGVAERSACDRITAHTDRLDWSNLVEHVAQVGLSDIRLKIAYVERGRSIGRIGITLLRGTSVGRGRSLLSLWSSHV